GIAHHLHAVDVELLVVRSDLVVELQRVRHPGAPAALHAHPQKHVLEVLRLEELLHVCRCLFRQSQGHIPPSSLSSACFLITRRCPPPLPSAPTSPGSPGAPP